MYMYIMTSYLCMQLRRWWTPYAHYMFYYAYLFNQPLGDWSSLNQ